jgi:hypothetical protein
VYLKQTRAVNTAGPAVHEVVGCCCCRYRVRAAR